MFSNDPEIFDFPGSATSAPMNSKSIISQNYLSFSDLTTRSNFNFIPCFQFMPLAPALDKFWFSRSASASSVDILIFRGSAKVFIKIACSSSSAKMCFMGELYKPGQLKNCPQFRLIKQFLRIVECQSKLTGDIYLI